MPRSCQAISRDTPPRDVFGCRGRSPGSRVVASVRPSRNLAIPVTSNMDFSSPLTVAGAAPALAYAAPASLLAPDIATREHRDTTSSSFAGPDVNRSFRPSSLNSRNAQAAAEQDFGSTCGIRVKALRFASDGRRRSAHLQLKNEGDAWHGSRWSSANAATELVRIRGKTFAEGAQMASLKP